MRRKGIAQMMMDRLIEECNNREKCVDIYLHTLSTNIPAMCFYEKNLFQKISLIEFCFYISSLAS
jgi:ribosomal protein S18 acetylase RimI-like enzyme